MKAVALIGSLRKDSYNRQLIQTVRERYPEQLDLEIADIGSIPLFNEDVEETPGEAVEKLRLQVKEAEAVLIATPEYNWSIPGVLKNAIDWLSREERPLTGKPVLLMGVSNGQLGTFRAQQHLRQVLSSKGVEAAVLSPAGNEIYVTFGTKKFEDGRLTDEKTLDRLDKVISRFLLFAEGR